MKGKLELVPTISILNTGWGWWEILLPLTRIHAKFNYATKASARRAGLRVAKQLSIELEQPAHHD